MFRILFIAFCLMIAVESLAAIGLQWDKTFPESEAPYFVRIDHQGNIYVIGRFYVESPENAEIFVKKFHPDSTLAWSDTTFGTDLKLPIAAQVDAQGNVYVLAQYASENVSPAVVYRFNASNGGIDWDETFLPAGNYKQSAARDLAVDAAGNVIVCANFIIDNPAQPLRADARSFLLSYSSAGTLLWQREDALSEPSVTFERLATFGTTIYVAGGTLAQNNSVDGFVAGFSTSGDSLWTSYSGLSASTGVFVQGTAVDSSGNFLAVFSDAANTIYKKFSPAGSQLFNLTGPRLGFNYVNPICSDRLGRFYWVAWGNGGQQLLQGRNSNGNLILDKSLGSMATPFPIKFGGNNTLLTWSTTNQLTQYLPSGNLLWTSTEAYSSVGDFVSNATGQSYWILYLFDDVVPDLLYRKLVKYDLGRNCGDLNGSGDISIADAVYFIDYIFGGGNAPLDKYHGDLDCSGEAVITDIVYFINYMFSSGPAPCQGCP